jgi:3-methyladenine DNA glycosylase AlkC
MRKINPNIHIVKIQIPYTPKEIKEEIKNLTPLNIIQTMLKDDEELEKIVNIFKQIQKEVEDETGKISN